MKPEIPVEMVGLPERLRQWFEGKLPESVIGKTPEEKERNFLSRALAACAIHKLAGATLDEAAQSIVDGGGDGGIDAVFHSPVTNTIWLVQSKFIASGRGEPELGDVTKFKTGLENLLQGQFEAFEANEAWNNRLPFIQSIIEEDGLQIRAVLVYTGINIVSEDRKRLFEDLKRRFSLYSDYLDVAIFSLTSVHDWLIEEDKEAGVERVDLTILNPGWVQKPYETIFGLVPLKTVAALYREHGKRLIVDNIRRYRGRTDVNEHILKTAKQEPHHFFYLNNGLTAFCQRLVITNTDRGKVESKRITAHGFSIVNGAQTLGTLAGLYPELNDDVPEGHVFVKIISLERCEKNREFADCITRSTNLQNQIDSRDFVALDNLQELIANQLLMTGITYHYKKGDDEARPDETNFTFEEAVTACAALVNQNNGDLCAKILANRQSLWSMEPVDKDNELFPSIYSKVFRFDRSARAIWRAVQTQRIVLDVMKNSGRASSGLHKTFFETARWLVLHLIFIKMHPEYGDNLSLTEEEKERITRLTIDTSVRLWRACEILGFVSARPEAGPGQYEQPRHFKSVFCSAADCQSLRGKTLALLAEVAV
jgi:hypothetical protein